MKTSRMVFFDWAMDYHLREKENFEILEGFLSELLRQKIIIRNIVKSDIKRMNIYGRFNQVEILAETDHNELTVIELQHGGIADYFYRMQNAINKSSEDYTNVCKAYSVNILYFDLNKSNDDYIYVKNSGLNSQKKLHLDNLERELCFKTTVANLTPVFYLISTANFENNEPKNRLDEWIFYLKYSKIRDNFTAQGMDLVRKKLAFENLTDEEQKQHSRKIDGRRVDDSVIQTALFNGKIKGQAKAIEMKKHDKLKAEKEEAQGKLKTSMEKVVINSYKAGLPIETIVSVTGLTNSEIITILKFENLL